MEQAWKAGDKGGAREGRAGLGRRVRIGAFSALAVGIALAALASLSHPPLPKPGSSLPGASALARGIAGQRWGFGAPLAMVDAPGTRTAKAAMVGDECVIWRDGDAASAPWWRAFGGRAGLYVDLHEMAHCQEEGTAGYRRRRASLGATDMARAREVYADAMAFSALGAKAELAGIAAMSRSDRDAHDSGFAARCLVAMEGGVIQSDEQRAQSCADQSVGLAERKASLAPKRSGRS